MKGRTPWSATVSLAVLASILLFASAASADTVMLSAGCDKLNWPEQDTRPRTALFNLAGGEVVTVTASGGSGSWTFIAGTLDGTTSSEYPLGRTATYVVPTSGLYEIGWISESSGVAWQVSCSAPGAPQADSDDDRVAGSDDECADTELSDLAQVPRLTGGGNAATKNRYGTAVDGKWVNGYGVPLDGYTIIDTRGCSLSQTVAAAGLGSGHLKYGITLGELESWIG